jgi:cytochrome c5
MDDPTIATWDDYHRARERAQAEHAAALAARAARGPAIFSATMCLCGAPSGSLASPLCHALAAADERLQRGDAPPPGGAR